MSWPPCQPIGTSSPITRIDSTSARRSTPLARVAWLCHLIDADDLTALEPAFGHLSFEKRQELPGPLRSVRQSCGDECCRRPLTNRGNRSAVPDSVAGHFTIGLKRSDRRAKTPIGANFGTKGSRRCAVSRLQRRLTRSVHIHCDSQRQKPCFIWHGADVRGTATLSPSPFRRFSAPRPNAVATLPNWSSRSPGQRGTSAARVQRFLRRATGEPFCLAPTRRSPGRAFRNARKEFQTLKSQRTFPQSLPQTLWSLQRTLLTCRWDLPTSPRTQSCVMSRFHQACDLTRGPIVLTSLSSRAALFACLTMRTWKSSVSRFRRDRPTDAWPKESCLVSKAYATRRLRDRWLRIRYVESRSLRNGTVLNWPTTRCLAYSAPNGERNSMSKLISPPPELYGGKAAVLLELQSAGFRVPEFVVSPSDLAEAVNTSGDSVGRALFGTAEDGQTVSFAGQFSSYLNLCSFEEIEAAVRKCRESVQTPSVVE